MKSLQHELLVAVLFAVSVPSLVSQHLASSPFTALVQDQPVHNAGPEPDSTSVCSYTFSSGSGNTFLKFCVTVNGNVTQLETPAGQEFIRKGGFSEGYAVCDQTSGGRYYDYADWGDSGNWQAPTTVSQSAKSVKIARTTSDGLWTLSQTFSLDAATPAAKIVMALKNNATGARLASLIRYSDIDVGDGALPRDNFASSHNGAWGFSNMAFNDPLGGDPNMGNGLMLKNTGNTPLFAIKARVQNTDVPPWDPCPTPPLWSPLFNVDGAVVLYWLGIHAIPAGNTATVKMVYRGM